jgi:hypothetical protein
MGLMRWPLFHAINPYLYMGERSRIENVPSIPTDPIKLTPLLSRSAGRAPSLSRLAASSSGNSLTASPGRRQNRQESQAAIR